MQEYLSKAGTIAPELELLAQEARKYKNAEEFAKSILPKYNKIQLLKTRADEPDIKKQIDDFYEQYPGISKIMDYVSVDYERGNALQDWVMQKIFGRPVIPGEAYPGENFFGFYNQAVKETTLGTGHLKK